MVLKPFVRIFPVNFVKFVNKILLYLQTNCRKWRNLLNLQKNRGYCMLFVNKLKVLTLMTCLVLVGQGFAEGEKCAANTTWGGFKTEIATKGTDGYYEIDTPEKLAWFSCEITKNGTASQKTNAKLTQSIDLQGKLFIPISAGKGTPSYGGIFDGQGYTIKNLFIKGSEIVKKENGGKDVYAQNIGLFAALKGGTVKNVTLTDVEIYAASSAGDAGTSGKANPISVGSIAGYVEAGSIDRCTASGKIETSGSTNRVGGIAGNVWAATISNSISEVDILSTGDDTHVGGVVGAVRKDGSVTLSSCVYAGETLFSDRGSVGAVVGNYEKTIDITTNDLYYTGDYSAVGVGLGDRPFNSEQVENLNTAGVICELNGGTWNDNDKTCSGESADAAWSEGQNGLSMNGSDGFKVTFDANEGSFTEGTKISKFFAKNATITANEIENPAFTGNKFAGWSLTQNGDVQSLGLADKAKTIYAVWKPIRTITFNAAPGTFDGGLSEVSKNVAEGDVVTVEGLPALPVKFCSQETAGNCDKYAYFHGWSTESHAPYGENDVIPEESIVDLPTFVFNSNTTLYAVWVESETYTVTFNANSHGQTKVAFVKVGKGETTVQPADPVADDGYVFTNRWCEEVPCDDNTKFDFEHRLIDRSIVLYADWSVPDYDITYIIDGEPDTETGNPAEYNVESGTITLAKPEKAGYEFDGWYDEDGNEATTILSGSTGDKIFYGSLNPVTYTITYLADNTLSATTTSDVKQHGIAKELKGATFVHGGCTQDGWSKVSYGKDGYNLDFAVNGSYKEDKDAILFPHWNCGTYTITYEVFGMSVTNRNPSQYTGPAKITLENAFDPEKKYFFMDNWYKESTFKTVIRDIQNIDANLTVYAKWYNKIYYKPGSNATGKAFEEKKYFDSTYTITAATNKFTRANYTIDGWSTTDGGDKVYELGGKYNTNENLTLYPHWVANTHTITYNNVDPSELPEGYPTTYTHESAVTLPVPTRNGYDFLGWYVDDEFNGEVVTEIPENQTEDKEFFAKWSGAVEYSITYNLDDGTNDVDNPASYTVETPAFTLKDAVKLGYTFDGWFNESDVPVTTVAGGATGDIELTAQWTPVEYTITYENVNGATNDNATTYTIEQTVVLNDLEKDGFSFRGWYDNDALSGNVVTEIPQGNTGAKTFYAKWLEIFTITYAAGEEAGVTGEVTAGTKTEGDDATLSDVGFTREGYTQTGWKTLDGSATYAMGAAYTTDASVTLYPIWLKVYTITYELNGGTNAEGNPDSYTSDDLPITLLEPTKAGSKFEGWYYNSDFSGDRVDGIYTVGSDDNITLYAHWLEYPITVAQYGGVKITENEDGTREAEIDGNSTAKVNIPTADNVSVDQVVFNRDFSGGVKSTVMFPFTVSLNDVSGGEFWEFMAMEYSSETGWLFRIKEPDDNELKANKPYIFIADQETKNIEFNLSGPVSLSTDVMNPSVHNGWAFKGVYEKVTFNADHPDWTYAYGYSNETKRNVTKGSFVRFKTSGFEKIDLAPMRAYLVYEKTLAKSASMDDNINVGSLPEFIDVEIVGKNGLAIGGGVLNTTTGELKMDRWYDLRGRKLNGKPTTQGTYYYNGKRIIVR